MLKKWIIGACLGAFLSMNTGAGIEQAYAGTPITAPIHITDTYTAELSKHHGDRHRPPQEVRGHQDRGPHHIKHRGSAPKYDRHDRHDRHQPPPHHRDRRDLLHHPVLLRSLRGFR